MAENSPLTAEPLVNSANILLSYGVQKDDIMDTLKRLGDLSKGKDDVLESLVMGYSRIIAEDRVTREHLDRFIFKGQVPIYDALAKSMNIDKKQLAKEMEAGNVKADNLIAAVHLLTDQGGQFYDAMNKLNDTLEGQTQQFLEKLDRVFGVFGGVFAPFFKESLKNVINPMLSETRGILEKYLVPDKSRIKYEYDKETNTKTKIIYDTDTTVNIWKALKKVLDALIPDLKFIRQVMENLKNGTSLFYVFVDVLVAFINGLKMAFKVFTVILNVLRPFRHIIVFLAGALVFATPFMFVLTKLASLTLFWFSVLKNGITIFIALKNKISFMIFAIRYYIYELKLLIPQITAFFTSIKTAIAGLAGTTLGTVAVIGLVIAAVIGLSLIFGQLYKRFEWFRKIVDGFTGFLYKIADKLKTRFKDNRRR